MAKKKNSPQVINNIRELNLEIDYDKLAEAIVKAQEKSVAPNDKKEKIGFWRAVWLVVRNKESQSGKRGAVLLSEIMAFVFNVIAIIGLALGVVLVIANIRPMMESSFRQGLLTFLIVIVSVFLSFSASLIFRGVANEMKAERDRNYIISVFSGIVSFAALIVALIALFKGVG